ncbi:MAG TPA: hypothetical protein PLC59_00565 [Bacteroidales bacterium]|jgi:hypothetical protein|nr:hypothetical protein [Bacteroidales bacterium]HQI44557.1 hypothetical protein [Bacteroidales bacterium]
MAISNQALIRFPGSGSAVAGNTAFGMYDNDPQFQKDCYNSMIWAARRLGYPTVAIEMIDIQFYAAFEEACNVYNAKVNEYNMINNMLALQGLNRNTSITGRVVQGSGLTQIINIAKDYGSEAGTGGKIDWKKVSIQINPMQQDYDLQALIGDVFENCDRIEVKRVFHYRPPAFARIYDPFSMTGMSYSNVLQELGFGAYSPAVQFLMTPIFEDLLRGQAIQFNDLVRKSAFSFEMVNNRLRIMPIPTTSFKLWIEYINERERYEASALSPAGSAGQVSSDFANIPYVNHPYSTINDAGKQWIRDYFLANCKEILGAIRQKHQVIPIPGGEVTLDGAELRSEAQQTKERLLDILKEQLEAAGRFSQIEKQAAMSEQIQNTLKGVPLLIYVGLWMFCAIIIGI